MMPTTPGDFLQRVVTDTGGMAVTILAAIGDRLGFFKDLSTAGPSTFDGVAARTGAHPRYVLEWLRAMVAAGYVEYDPHGERFPKCTCVGYDVFAPVVERATANALTAGVAQRVHFQVVDAAERIPEKYDLITAFDVVHDAPRPLELLQRIRAALNPGGRYVCMDVNCSDRLEENVGPVAALRYGFSVFYCMPISLASGGEGLGTMGLPESKIRDLCARAGFSSFRRVPLEGSIHSVYEATRS